MLEYTLNLDLAAYHREISREMAEAYAMNHLSCETCDAGNCSTCLERQELALRYSR